MTVPPCPTCRHYVIHLHELGATIATRRTRVRLSEHRAAIHDLATHLTEHAEGAGT